MKKMISVVCFCIVMFLAIGSTTSYASELGLDAIDVKNTEMGTPLSADNSTEIHTCVGKTFNYSNSRTDQASSGSWRFSASSSDRNVVTASATMTKKDLYGNNSVILYTFRGTAKTVGTGTATVTYTETSPYGHSNTSTTTYVVEDHDYVYQSTVEPTENEAGYDIYKCSRCSDEVRTNYKCNLTYAQITLPATQYQYTGEEIRPLVSVTAYGVSLTEGEDFTVDYRNNTAIGTATVTITGKGECYGVVEKTFKIYSPGGWANKGGQWYYYNSSGAMVTGWQKISDVWYYMGPNGIMQTGWVLSGGNWYYMNSSGAMVTGWQQIGGTWYYFAGSGAMVTGWQQISGTWYFFKSSGAMAANEWCGGYWLNANGSWTYKPIGSWKKDGNGWWFGDTSGWYAKNATIKIDNVWYKFNAAGYWVK